MVHRTHDPTFKFAFGGPREAAELVRHVLPRHVCDALELDTIVRVSGSFVDTQLSERYSDLLFTVRSRSGSVFVYILIEHQSSNDADMPLRLLEYMVRIWTEQRRNEPGAGLRPIIPLLICHPVGGWTAPRRLDELFHDCPAELRVFIPSFEVAVQDLGDLDDDEIKRWSIGACQQLALWMLRDARTTQRFREHLPAWRDQFEAAAASPTGLEFLAVLFRYMMAVNEDLALAEIRARIIELAPAAENTLMTIAEQLLQQGRAEGRAEGRADMLERLLRSKFGALTEQTRARLAQASVDELMRWAERLLAAATLDEVFGD